MTACDSDAGTDVTPGTDAFATITTGAPAAIAASNGTNPTRRNVPIDGVAPGRTSVLPTVPPRPGKCLTTGSTPPARNPFMNATPYADAVAALPLNERRPS